MLKVAVIGDSRASHFAANTKLREQIGMEIIGIKRLPGANFMEISKAVYKSLEDDEFKGVTDIWIVGFVGDVAQLESSLVPGYQCIKMRNAPPSADKLGNQMKELTRYSWRERKVRVLYFLPSHLNPVLNIQNKLRKKEGITDSVLRAYTETHEQFLKGIAQKIHKWYTELEEIAFKVFVGEVDASGLEVISLGRIVRADEKYWEMEKKSWSNHELLNGKYLYDGVHWSKEMVEAIVTRITRKYKKNFGEGRFKVTQVQKPIMVTREVQTTTRLMVELAVQTENIRAKVVVTKEKATQTETFPVEEHKLSDNKEVPVTEGLILEEGNVGDFTYIN